MMKSDLFALLEETRLVVDLRDEVSLFTQIASISAGIPQVNKKTSDYVAHKKEWLFIK